MVSQPKRFEVWLVNLDPTKGREINKTRPCVVVPPNELGKLSTVLMAPMTSQGFALPCRVACDFQGKSGFILLDQLRAVDKQRLVKKLGSLTNETQAALCHTLVTMFSL
ncbi:type II toxin-antitoxin system PemK/MazF family toxin [Arsukibacterium sp.]|uniref:type II toxin-antitoxin system PemK/MazF family toxin n=1 Tax=Arsukibacterium sp. TaxID=1977258 RepID=UPI002FDA16AB